MRATHVYSSSVSSIHFCRSEPSSEIGCMLMLSRYIREPNHYLLSCDFYGGCVNLKQKNYYSLSAGCGGGSVQAEPGLCGEPV